MASRYIEDIKAVLETAEKPLTIKEISQKIATRRGEKVPQNTIYGTLKEREGANLVIKTPTTPLTFWLKSRKDEFDAANLEKVLKEAREKEKREAQKIESKFKERDLHKLFVSFADESMGLICKTYYHERCIKENSGGIERWNYPDIVGVKFPRLESKTTRFLSNLSHNLYQMYSFELKIMLNSSNFKERYFQAVANSTWANEGYLVVFYNIDDPEVKEELERLNQIFGIGVIVLEKKPSESKVIFPAKQRELNIRTLDMLVHKNPDDFGRFIDDVSQKINAMLQGDDAPIHADEVLKGDTLENYLKEKNIDK